MNISSDTKCGFVAILGMPNAGKSTLTNLLAGEHVSIVSPKVQTTRFPVKGLFIEDDTQVILIDTPGLFQAKGKLLEEKMVESALAAQGDADLVVYLVDANRAFQTIKKNQELYMPEFTKGASIFLAFNKIDMLEKEALLALSEKFNEAFAFAETFFISALKGSGVEDLKRAMIREMPESPWLFPEDQVTDLPLKLFAAELTREALFNRLNQELPYNLAVQTEKIEDRDGCLIVNQVIFIKNEKHKPIILGKGGQTIKAIGTSARKTMEKDLDQKVHLSLFVKVKKNWDTDRELLSSWMLDV